MEVCGESEKGRKRREEGRSGERKELKSKGFGEKRERERERQGEKKVESRRIEKEGDSCGRGDKWE